MNISMSDTIITVSALIIIGAIAIVGIFKGLDGEALTASFTLIGTVVGAALFKVIGNIGSTNNKV